MALVKLFDPAVVAQGKVLWSTSSGFGVSIEPGCNGVEAFIVLCAALVAFPASWMSRLKGLAAGFIAIQALNVVRVISLFYLGQWSRPAFQFAHEYLWQGLIMLDVLAVWLIWVRLVAPPPGSGPDTPDEPPGTPPAGHPTASGPAAAGTPTLEAA